MLGSKSMFILNLNIISHPFTKLEILTKIKTQNIFLYYTSNLFEKIAKKKKKFASQFFIFASLIIYKIIEMLLEASRGVADSESI